jgi:hypothetical protein
MRSARSFKGFEFNVQSCPKLRNEASKPNVGKKRQPEDE